MKLESLGWSPQLAEAWQAQALPPATPHPIPGRLVRIDGRRATAATALGEHLAELPSRLRHADGMAVVGDWAGVVVEADGSARVECLLPRRTILARRAAGRGVRRQLLAANIDVVFVVMALDDDFSERRLERYLTVIHDGGARPVVLLTKAGLCDDAGPWVERARAVAPGVDVHAIDVLAGIEVDAPRRYLAPGVTAVLVGSSGVGKSTLLNDLLGEERMATGAVRARDGKGQHTTTHRELFVLPTGGVVIDTPGLRALAPWAEASALDQAFADVEALAAQCRFGDCTHEHEPGCAVRQAVEDGTLDGPRFRSFVALRRELALTEAQRAPNDLRRRARSFGKVAREAQRMKRGRR